jgi:metal-responsive CopG/Arc/MetJ family transcriptional regulator
VAKEKAEYVVVKLPRDLTDEMDRVVGYFGYRSRAEVAKDGIRRLLTDLPMEDRGTD